MLNQACEINRNNQKYYPLQKSQSSIGGGDNISVAKTRETSEGNLQIQIFS